MEVSKSMGPERRDQKDIICILGVPKRGPLVFVNPDLGITTKSSIFKDIVKFPRACRHTKAASVVYAAKLHSSKTCRSKP